MSLTVSNPTYPGKIGYLLKTYPKISETFILQEILALERLGVDLTIFSLQRPTDAQVPELAHDVRAPIYYIPNSLEEMTRTTTTTHLRLLEKHPRQFRKSLEFFEQRKEGGDILEFYQAGHLAVMLENLGIHHLHAHFANQPTGIAELVSHLTNMPYSFTAHAKDLYLSHPDVLDRKIQQAQFVITCTRYNQAYLERLSTTRVPIHCIYHGLDMSRFSTRPSTPAPERQQPIPSLLSVGRLREKKGFPTLLRACRLLKTWGYEFHCRMIGYGPLQQELEQLRDNLDLHTSVTFSGKLTPQDVIHHYRAADVFLLPCQVEANGDRDGIPNVLMEAMAMEVPVVTTTVSGIPELITNGTHGFLVAPQDPTALAQATAHLLDNPALRQQMGRNGREKIAREFSALAGAQALRDQFLWSGERQPDTSRLTVEKRQAHLHAHF